MRCVSFMLSSVRKMLTSGCMIMSFTFLVLANVPASQALRGDAQLSSRFSHSMSQCLIFRCAHQVLAWLSGFAAWTLVGHPAWSRRSRPAKTPRPSQAGHRPQAPIVQSAQGPPERPGSARSKNNLGIRDHANVTLLTAWPATGHCDSRIKANGPGFVRHAQSVVKLPHEAHDLGSQQPPECNPPAYAVSKRRASEAPRSVPSPMPSHRRSAAHLARGSGRPRARPYASLATGCQPVRRKCRKCCD